MRAIMSSSTGRLPERRPSGPRKSPEGAIPDFPANRSPRLLSCRPGSRRHPTICESDGPKYISKMRRKVASGRAQMSVFWSSADRPVSSMMWKELNVAFQRASYTAERSRREVANRLYKHDFTIAIQEAISQRLDILCPGQLNTAKIGDCG